MPRSGSSGPGAANLTSRLKAQGKGEADPVVACTDKKLPALIKCLEPNRRVEVENITIERRLTASSGLLLQPRNASCERLTIKRAEGFRLVPATGWSIARQGPQSQRRCGSCRL